MPKEPGVLYVKYKDTDDGTQVIPEGVPFWTSPSVWLTGPGGESKANGPDDTTAYAGENWVHVQVDSTSTTDYEGIGVQVWVCDYTMGFIGPDSARPSVKGATGKLGSIHTAVHKGTPGTMHVSWTPDADDLINSPNPGQGHECVAVNVYYENLPAPEGARMSTGRLDVINNRHHAQCNLTILDKSRPAQMIAMRLTSAGVEAEDFEVRAWELDREGGIGALEQEKLLARCSVDLVGGEPKPPLVPPGCQTEPLERTWLRGGGQLVLTGLPEPAEIRVAGHDAEFTVLTDRSCEGGEEEGAEQQSRGSGGGRGGAGLTVNPGELAPVLLRLDCDGDAGEVHTIDVVQRSDDGVVLGGARLVVLHVPEWYHC